MEGSLSWFCFFFLSLSLFVRISGVSITPKASAFYPGHSARKNAALAVCKGQLSHARASLGCVFGKVGEGAPTASLTSPTHRLPESGKNVLETLSLPFCTWRKQIFSQPSLSFPHLHSWL